MSAIGLVVPWVVFLASWVTTPGDYQLQRPGTRRGHASRSEEPGTASPLERPSRDGSGQLERARREESAGHDRQAADVYLSFLEGHPTSRFSRQESLDLVALFVRAGTTLPAAPFILSRKLATRDFWREVFVDARTEIETSRTQRLLARGLGELSRPPATAESLQEALDTIVDYPPSPAIEKLLASFCVRPGMSATNRSACWQARARRAALDHKGQTFEDAVVADGSTEAWLAFAELLHDSGRPAEIVRRAWTRAPQASPARLRFLDAIHEERAAAEESESLAERTGAPLAARQDAFRRWIKLRVIARAQNIWDLSFSRGKRDRDELEWLVQAAVRLPDEERLGKAASRLGQLDPHDESTLEAIGEAWDLVGQRQRALVVWKTLPAIGVARSASSSARAVHLAEILLRHDRPAAALDVLAPALRRHPEDVALLRVEALVLENERRRDEAFASWWKILEKRSDREVQGEARRHLGALVSSVRSSDLEKASAALRQRLREQPDPADAALMSRLLRQLGRTDEAREMLTATARQGLVDKDALTTLASALRDLHAPAEERALWIAASAPGGLPCPYCVLQRALTSYQQGRWAESEQILEEARTGIEGDGTTSSRLAELAERLSRPDLARHFLDQTLTLEPTNLGARLSSARWRLRANDPEGAALLEMSREPHEESEPGASDLATQEMAQAREDLAAWRGEEAPSQGRPGRPSIAELLARVRSLEKGPVPVRASSERNQRLSALRELGVWSIDRPLPFRAGRALRFSQGEDRASLIWYAGLARDPEAAPALFNLIHETEPPTAALAVLAWQRTTGTGATDALLKILADSRGADEVRSAAAFALAWASETADIRSTDALRQAMASAPAMVARSAARALAALSPADQREEIQSRARLHPGSPTADAWAKWGVPLPTYIDWPCQAPVEGLTALEDLRTAPRRNQLVETCSD